MITTVLIWLYIFIISTASGHLLFKLCLKLFKTESTIYPDLAELSFFGLSGIGVFLSYFSIFYKIGIVSNFMILLILVFYFISNTADLISYFKNQFKNFLHYPSLIKLFSAIYLIMILFSALSYPKIYDTGLYHAQFIQWISSFKTIPGLGNLHGRFAYNNQSFLLESFFSFSFLKFGSFHLLNSYLLLVLSFSLILSLFNTLVSDWLKSFLYFGLLVLFQIFHLPLVSSPTPDIYSTIGIWFIFIFFLKRYSSSTDIRIYWLIILFSAFFLVTVKLSSIPIVLLVVFFLMISEWTFVKKSVIIISLGLMVFIPFFIRNYLISGYLIYPYPVLDLFNPDWKIPSSFVAEMKSVIASFAQCRDWQVRPFREWLPIWFAYRSPVFRILSVFILFSPFLMFVILSIKRSLLNIFRNELKVMAICLIAIIFWFITAPNFRFVYGFLFVYLLLFAMIYLHFFIYGLRIFENFRSGIKEFMRIIYKKFVYAVLIVFPLIFFVNCDYSETAKCIVYPAGYKTVPLNVVTINNLKVNVPEDNAQCWDACIPCSIFQNNIGITNIEMRGTDIKDGFRVKK
jgi:hypothetical protein